MKYKILLIILLRLFVGSVHGMLHKALDPAKRAVMSNAVFVEKYIASNWNQKDVQGFVQPKIELSEAIKQQAMAEFASKNSQEAVRNWTRQQQYFNMKKKRYQLQKADALLTTKSFHTPLGQSEGIFRGTKPLYRMQPEKVEIPNEKETLKEDNFIKSDENNIKKALFVAKNENLKDLIDWYNWLEYKKGILSKFKKSLEQYSYPFGIALGLGGLYYINPWEYLENPQIEEIPKEAIKKDFLTKEKLEEEIHKVIHDLAPYLDDVPIEEVYQKRDIIITSFEKLKLLFENTDEITLQAYPEAKELLLQINIDKILENLRSLTWINIWQRGPELYSDFHSIKKLLYMLPKETKMLITKEIKNPIVRYILGL